MAKVAKISDVAQVNGHGGPSDNDLIKRTVAGDEQSFAILEKRYHRHIVNVIYRMVGDFETSMDLAQEVFFKAYRALDRFDPKFKFSTWLYRVAMNAAIDYHRKREITTTPIEIAADEQSDSYEWQMPSDDISPEQKVFQHETAEQISKVVKQLPEEYRELIALRYTNDLSYSEIAEQTGMPLGTVKNRLFRAHQMLRGYLSDMALAA
ncbi:MAG TPA: sigma-70 family RNA polymerase sigma factor [Blastocatellia bacterium]|nr:sigma-70 family RNA polymerase sigma factor [Blastocatellia bacterium]